MGYVEAINRLGHVHNQVTSRQQQRRRTMPSSWRTAEQHLGRTFHQLVRLDSLDVRPMDTLTPSSVGDAGVTEAAPGCLLPAGAESITSSEVPGSCSRYQPALSKSIPLADAEVIGIA